MSSDLPWLNDTTPSTPTGGVNNLSVPDTQPKTTGALGTAAQQYVENVVPNTAGLAAGTAATGALLAGGELASGPVGWAIAGLTFLGTQFGVDLAARAAQEGVEKNVMGEDKFNAYKQDLALNAKAHPIAAMAGSLATQLPFIGFSASNVGTAIDTAKELSALKSGAELSAWMKDSENVKKAGDLLGVSLGAGVGGVQDATQQIQQGGDFKWLELGGNIAAGAFMNKPTALSEYIGARVGGPLGELLNRNIIATDAEKAAWEKAGLTKQMQSLHEQAVQGMMNGDIAEQGALDRAHNIAKDLLQGAQDSEYLDDQQNKLVNELAEHKAKGKMVDAQISDVEDMRKQDIANLSLQQNQLELATSDIGGTHINSGIVASDQTYAPSRQPDYAWGQDPTRDVRKTNIANDINSLNKKLEIAKANGESDFRKNQLASQIDQRIRDYHDIQDQSWEERLADQQIPVKANAEENKVRMELGAIQKKYSLQDSRDSVNNASDSLVAELLHQRESHALAEAQLQRPGELERRANQIVVKSGNKEWQDRLNSFKKQAAKEAFRQRRAQEQATSDQALGSINESISAFREKAAQGRTNGNTLEADSIDRYLDRINEEPDTKKKIEMLKQLDPKHPTVRALTEELDAYEVTGTFDQLPKTNPDAGIAADIDKNIGIKVRTAAVDKIAPIGEVSREALAAHEGAQGRSLASAKEAQRDIGKASTNLYKAGRVHKLSGNQVHAEADAYAHAMSDMDKGEIHGYGKNRIETKEELQARIDSARQKPYFKAIDAYQKALAKVSQENLAQAYKIGKISKQWYDVLSAKYKNYIPARTDLSELDSLGSYGGRPNTPVREFEGASPIAERVSPAEAVMGQRAQLNVNEENYSLIKELMANAAKGGKAASIFEFSKELKPGWKTGGNTMKYNLANGEALYIHSNSVEVAKSMNGLHDDQIPAALSAMGKMTNFIARMAVRQNPGFWGAGFAYDVFSAIQNIATTPIAKLRIPFVVNWLKQVGPSFGSRLELLGAKIDPWTARYEKAGGLSGGYIQGPEKTLQQIKHEAEIMAQGGLRALLHKVWQDIGNVNEALMNMPRVAAFRTAIEGGLSEAEAVQAAHDIGPNYLVKGSWANAVGQYKAFTTASMAGMDRFYRSLFVNGKFDQGKFATFIAGSLAANMLIRSRNDTVDKYWRDKWDGDKNWVFAIDRTHAVTIPMEWAQRPVHMLTGMITDAANGKKDITEDDIFKVASMASSAYSPFGAQGVTGFAPTPLEAPIQIATNQSYSGKAIVGEGLQERMKEGLPAHLAFYNSFGKNLMEQAGIKMTDDFSQVGIDKLTPQQATYELDNVFGGPAAILQGNLGQNRFFKTMDDDRASSIEQAAEAAPFNKQMAAQKAQIATDRFEESQRIEQMAGEVFKMPLDEQKEAVLSIAEKNPDEAHELVQQLGKMAIIQMRLPKIPSSKSK